MDWPVIFVGEGDSPGPDGILFKRVALGWQPRVHLLKMVRYTLEVPPHPGCQSPSALCFIFSRESLSSFICDCYWFGGRPKIYPPKE